MTRLMKERASRRSFVAADVRGRIGFAAMAGHWLRLLVSAAALVAMTARADVPVVLSPQAQSVERAAAEDLASSLGSLYPREKFTLAGRLPNNGRCIVVGSDPRAQRLAKTAAPAAPESFTVTAVNDGSRELGVIAGADARGTARGVYALLEKLGCGFYLSYDALPPARESAFSFDGWQLADRPLVRDRIVFDWHNFLSGCSTWNLPEWQAWIRQSQKMGYNAIMVHAYGNNPMVSFTFNGRTKPVGYLSTTARGRDWSTMHVNDVRRLFGGEVFNAPVFGADAAQGPEEQRAGAAQKLMQGVFACAGDRAMDVFFADDVDTGSANPQELILTLPENARFATRTKAGGMTGVKGEGETQFWLANPDTSEGYRYYKAQVTTLLKAYPQITTLIVWFRQGGTPWMEIKVAEMPPAWQREYEAEIAKTPEAAKLWHAPQMFAIGKIVRAFDRALRECGGRARVAAGTWDFKFLAPCHRFFPPGVKLIGLDYNALHGHPQLGDDESRRVIREVAAKRPVVPVIWAHHDDGNYLGRSYTPFAQFGSKLADAQACGFGIIHWTTRPLDLYFKSHIEQVWAATKDRPLRATCDDMAARSFGTSAQAVMGGYLERWVTDAPIFSRETSDRFIDRQLTNITEVVTGCRERLKMIESVDTTKLASPQRDRLNYFKGLEAFIAAFFDTHGRFQDAQAALKKGDLAVARAAMAGCRPEPVIELYAKFSSLGGITRGEQGSVVSLNTRWLPHIVRLRQQIGLDAVRYNFGPTSHDPLAQSPGRFTFHFDAEHHLWQTLGAQETGAETFTLPAEASVANGICRSGIESDKPIGLELVPILAAKKDPATVPAGDYRLRLLMLHPSSTVAGQSAFRVSVAGTALDDILGIDIFSGANRVLERVYPITVGTTGKVIVTLTPVTGKANVCGAVLEPISEQFDASALCPASLVSEGDLARLQRAMAKARRGETTTVAVIGGSITQGARATKPENRYGNLIAAWWREKFPKARIEFVNAGIGATGSNYGALRARRDLLAQQPDFVVVEYSVNDRPLQESADTLEGLTRQILRQPSQPAAMLLFMMHTEGGNAQEWHAKVGSHYALPMVSYRDALWPEIKADRLKWETVMADQVHPNDAGHACAARFVTHLLEKVLKDLPPDDRLPAVAPVPAPLFTDLFEYTTLREADDLQPRRNDGWTLDKKDRCWRSDRPGSVIEFEIEGRVIYSMHFVVRKAMGKAKAQVDDGAPVTLNGWFDQTWGGYRYSTVLANDLKPGPHHVRIELLEEKSPSSEGHEFHILGLGAAGVR